MTYTYDGYNYIVKLKLGEKLIENLNAFAKEKQLGSMWLSGLGGASHATLGYYDLETREYEWKDFPELTEITSLQGNLSWVDGEPMWHIHATLSDRSFVAYGGHVKEIEAGATVELFLHSRFGDEKLERTYDDEIGLKLLNI